MSRLLRGLAAASITVSLGAALTLTGTSAASTGTTSASAVAGYGIPAALPQTTIQGSGSNLSFHPSSVSATWSAKTSTHTCTSKLARLIVNNGTSTKQTLTYKGSATGPAIPSGSYQYVCFYGSGSKTFKVHLKADSAATLIIKVT